MSTNFSQPKFLSHILKVYFSKFLLVRVQSWKLKKYFSSLLSTLECPSKLLSPSNPYLFSAKIIPARDMGLEGVSWIYIYIFNIWYLYVISAAARMLARHFRRGCRSPKNVLSTVTLTWHWRFFATLWCNLVSIRLNKTHNALT